MRLRVWAALCPPIVAALCLGCASDEFALPTPTAAVRLPSATPTVSAPATETPRAAPSPTPLAALEPVGFPIDPAVRLGVAVGEPGSQRIDWESGPDALTYSRDDQVAADPDRANRSGWNCRTHMEYEGQAAVDWDVPEGTPVYATMDGVATLSIVTVSNAFDYYGVDREPYLGNPDRSRAAVSPFPGPGGGKGVFVTVSNEGFVTEYGHLNIAMTVASVPAGAFLPGYGPDFDFTAAFAAVRDFRVFTPVARWNVRRGDLLGYSGDTGYSSEPHLHYTVRRLGGPLLCPTMEEGFRDGGWLFRD